MSSANPPEVHCRSDRATELPRQVSDLCGLLRSSCRAVWLIVMVAGGGSAPALAHPVSLTEVTVDVQRNQIETELKVLVEDLVLYYPVSADENNVYPSEALKEAAQHHRQFVLDGLRLLDQDGNRISGSIFQIDTSKISDEGVKLTEVKQVSVSYLLRSAMDEPLEFLTVSQSFGGENSLLPAIMECQVRQQGVVLDVPQPLLSGQTLTTRFDWNSTPTPPKNWRELKRRRDQRLKDQLGIASYSGLYSFLYITPHEVRHEILIPLLTLDEWVPIQRSNAEFLETDEQQNAKSQVAAFFQQGNEVTINGTTVQPQVSRISFFGLDIRDFALNAEPRRVSVAQARVGVMLNYPTAHHPQTVRIQWDTFSRYAPFLKSILYSLDEPAVEHFFRPEERVLIFNLPPSESRKPAARLANPGSRPTPTEANRISLSLLRNVYRAFDSRDEQETYDALAASVNGDLLRSLYLQIRRSLMVAEQDGSRSSVLDIQPVSGELTGTSSSAGFDIEFTWRVLGKVEHWGHIHLRENEYQARLSVISVDGFWKLGSVKFLSQKRVRFETQLRK